MSIHVPVRCDTCTAVLVIHCGSHTCAWLRCPNAGCVWGAVDVERGVRVDRDGHVEVVA